MSSIRRWDVSDNIGGLFTLRSHYTAPFAGSWRFHGGVSGTYATEDYMDEYFSINAADSARSGLNTYSADEGFKDVALDASLTYQFAGNWSATGSLKYTRLLGRCGRQPRDRRRRRREPAVQRSGHQLHVLRLNRRIRVNERQGEKMLRLISLSFGAVRHCAGDGPEHYVGGSVLQEH